MATNSWSSIHNIDNWGIWIWESGKANSWFTLISQQPDIDKICLYAKDPYQTKYQILIKVKDFNYSKIFIEYSNDMDDICKNIGEFNPSKT